jgi:NAD(P)H dehydrogenase (quinone)
VVKILVCYFSGSGNTKKMAEVVVEGAEKGGAEVDLKEVSDVSPDDLLNYDGIILGSPTYYGLPAGELKSLIDESVKHHGELEGKVGGAFSSCGVFGGGCETAVRSMLDMLMIHGMVIMGGSQGAHYGPVAVGKPDSKAKKECLAYGTKIAELTKKLHG